MKQRMQQPEFPNNRPPVPPPLPSNSCPYLASERQEFFGAVSLPFVWCIGHNEEKVRGFTIAEAQELWNFKGFAPVTGKVGFPRTSYNFCWAGGMWPRCMETGSRQWNCNGAAMEKWVVGGNLGSPRRA